MNLSKYITKAEFEFSQTAARKGIENSMTPEIEKQAILLCKNVIDPIRAFYKKPITINSGYRCKKLNRSIGGATTSQHCLGQAADFIIHGVELKTIFNDIASGKIPIAEPFDQLIFEFGNWVHVSRAPKPRKMKLHAFYQDKAVIYKPVNLI
jgi:hypothetical protein